MSKAYTELQGMDPEDSREYIELFAEEFGQLHLYFAQHAAFPLALTPDLLYRLWINFQRDCINKKHSVPWIAVADLLLSPLCKEVGYELYEMDVTIRTELLSMLKNDETLGVKRIQELSDFLLEYARLQLNENLSTRTSKLASVQRWTALAYTTPGKVARELSEALDALRQNGDEQIRVASLIQMLNVLTEPEEFKPLLVRAQNIEKENKGGIRKRRNRGRRGGRKIIRYDQSITEEVNEKVVEDEIGQKDIVETEQNIEILIHGSAEEDGKAIENVPLEMQDASENQFSSKYPPNTLLRTARLHRGWTQKKVAEQIDLADYHTVGRWERGEYITSLHYTYKLCDLFEMNAEELGLLPESVIKSERLDSPDKLIENEERVNDVEEEEEPTILTENVPRVEKYIQKIWDESYWESQNWRELLKMIISDDKEMRRICDAISVNPVTLQRWASNKSNPRMDNIRVLIETFPDNRSRSFFIILLEKEFPTFELSKKA